ncbi:hypothetical protein ACGFSB_01245 [Streptomyces sp. NPDC048441]|uniref:hypothetical protein n=1 Tax=Streptomyces sp. NPDC048441 TaxID=3365552 RepID=UPI00371B5366
MSTGRIRRRFAFGAGVLAATVLLGVVAGAGTAQAQASAGRCAGHKVRTLSFSTGKVVVYKSRSYVCAVTIAKRPGARKTMSVSVQARGNRPARDKGRYTHHAGPVTVHAGRRCVWVRGEVGGGSTSSGWILC